MKNGSFNFNFHQIILFVSRQKKKLTRIVCARVCVCGSECLRRIKSKKKTLKSNCNLFLLMEIPTFHLISIFFPIFRKINWKSGNEKKAILMKDFAFSQHQSIEFSSLVLKFHPSFAINEFTVCLNDFLNVPS